jgi:hypothetical protein
MGTTCSASPTICTCHPRSPTRTRPVLRSCERIPRHPSFTTITSKSRWIHRVLLVSICPCPLCTTETYPASRCRPSTTSNPHWLSRRYLTTPRTPAPPRSFTTTRESKDPPKSQTQTRATILTMRCTSGLHTSTEAKGHVASPQIEHPSGVFPVVPRHRYCACPSISRENTNLLYDDHPPLCTLYSLLMAI